MTFAALEEELGRWTDPGRPATLWWRDDDAGRATPALVRMLALAASRSVPLALAVIPAEASEDLLGPVAATHECTVVQHGFAHRNHAPPDERSCELGAHRAVAATVAELVEGREQLESRFGPQFVPVLVPPWNRIAPVVVATLGAAGFTGLSTFGPRTASAAAPGITQCNTHVDLIAWRRGRTFIGEDEAAARIAAHLALRRECRVDATEPTGLLTHHLDFDDAAWRFVEKLFDCTRGHAAASWISAAAAFGAARSLTCGRSA